MASRRDLIGAKPPRLPSPDERDLLANWLAMAGDVASTSQVDTGTWRQCDHRPSSALSTRRKARPSTSASTRTDTPPGSTISINPSRRDNGGDGGGTIEPTGS